MSLNSFIGPKPNLLDINAVNPPMRLEVDQPILDFDDMARLRDIERAQLGQVQAATSSTSCYPLAWGAEGVEAKLASLCAESGGRDPQRPQHPDHQRPAHGPRAGRHPRAAGAVGGPPAPGARRPAHDRRPGGRDRPAREVHHFAVLAGYGAEAVHPVPGDGDAGRRCTRTCRASCRPTRRSTTTSRRSARACRRSCRRWACRTYMSLLRRAAVRGHRPGQAAASTSTSAAPPVAGRRHRRVRGGRGSASACTAPPSATTRCWPTCSTPAANTPGACAAKSTCGRPTPSPSCSTARAPASSRPTRNTRRSSTTRASAT